MVPTWFRDAAGAVSLTFDDARASQLDVGIPILRAYGIRATFYALPNPLRKRRRDWALARAAGHEIGNHTWTHPCSANHASSRDNPLEEFSLARIEDDIERANTELARLVDDIPRTFAYPCGQTQVGRGEQKKSYVPVVARRFVAGRGYRSETANDPEACDLALLDAWHGDGGDVAALLEQVEAAVEQRRWLILVFHEVGAPGPISVDPDVLDVLCRTLVGDSRVWVAPVVDVATRVRRLRA